MTGLKPAMGFVFKVGSVAACTEYALFCTSDFPAIPFLFAPAMFR